jgi:hypothetical protein
MDRDMIPRICRCCGMVMETRAPDNPNICLACLEIDWSDTSTSERVQGISEIGRDSGRVGMSTLMEVEFDHFLEMEDPSVIECFDAVEQAKEAIAEVASVVASSVAQRASPLAPIRRPAVPAHARSPVEREFPL